MNRFFVDRDAIKEKTIEILLKEDINHISKVLRMRNGDKIIISDSSGSEYVTEILSITSDKIVVKILNKHRCVREPKTHLSLFQCVPKHGKIETVIQKSIELGVSDITPILSDRTIVKEKQNFKQKLKRWRRISKETAKQCKRGIIPKINDNSTFDEMLNMLSEYDLVLLPYENENRTSIKEVLRGSDRKLDKIAIIIGPEGGFSDKEVEKVMGLGGMSVTLGRTILRTETAGPATVAMIMYELEL